MKASILCCTTSPPLLSTGKASRPLGLTSHLSLFRSVSPKQVLPSPPKKVPVMQPIPTNANSTMTSSVDSRTGSPAPNALPKAPAKKVYIPAKSPAPVVGSPLAQAAQPAQPKRQPIEKGTTPPRVDRLTMMLDAVKGDPSAENLRAIDRAYSEIAHQQEAEAITKMSELFRESTLERQFALISELANACGPKFWDVVSEVRAGGSLHHHHLQPSPMPLDYASLPPPASPQQMHPRASIGT